MTKNSRIRDFRAVDSRDFLEICFIIYLILYLKKSRLNLMKLGKYFPISPRTIIHGIKIYKSENKPLKSYSEVPSFPRLRLKRGA